MRILVIDDNNQKIEKIVACLTTDTGIPRDDIDVAFNVFDAKTHLAANIYDLLIIDVLIPLRAGEPPKTDNSVTLLTELRDRATLRKPRHIIALTAFDEGIRALGPIFSQQTWATIKYTDDSVDWSSQIAGSVRYLSKVASEVGSIEYGCDVCILTALDTPEYEAVLRNGWDWGSAEPIDDTMFAQEASFESGGKSFRAIAAYCPKMGMVTSSIVASKLINLKRPKYIVMAGISAAVKGKGNYGDPILADPCWNWQSGKHVLKEGEKEFEISPEQVPVPALIRSRWDQLRVDKVFWSSLKDVWPGSPETELKGRVGPCVSGSAVIADPDIVEAIKMQHRQLVGLEMEAFGLYAAARMASAPRPTAFSIKSICDFADERKDDRWQTYAAFTSAKAITEFFGRFMSELDGLEGS